MECKWINTRIRCYVGRIKVEPYWNVNHFDTDNNLIAVRIKVEPYWNVNLAFLSVRGYIPTIKVEPYWNVNNILLFKTHI